MTPMCWDEMTPAQQAQAEGIFFDRLLNLDPNGYEYESDKAGQITGRCPLTRRASRPKLRSHPRVEMVTVIATSSEDNRCAIQHLARLALNYYEPAQTEITA